MEFKFALRSMRRSPGFTLLAVLILALGVGANTAIFSVVHGVVLRPLAYVHPEQLVSVSMAWPDSSGFGQVSGPDFEDLRSGIEAFRASAAYSDDIISVAANGKAEFTGASAVSDDFLAVLGVGPVAGRGFVQTDFNGGKARTALVSERFWERHFSLAFTPGQMLKADGEQLEIVGVLPSGFHFPESSHTEVWLPFGQALGSMNRGAHNFRVVARLHPGLTEAQAQVQAAIVAERLAKRYPDTNKTAGLSVASLTNFTVRRVKTSLYILLASVILVLLIACANVANLLLARGAGRLRELAIRAAVGATQARLIRQLSIETLLLAGIGTAAGVGLAYLILPVLLKTAPSFVPRLEEVRIDASVLAGSALAGVVSSLLFGLAPAWQASRTDPNRDLRGAGSRGVVSGPARRLRQSFVTIEIALCLTLLISAGLLLKSFSAMTQVDLGFRPHGLLVAHLSVPSGTAGAAVEHTFRPLLAKLSSLAGVEQAAITRGLPGDPDARSTVAYVLSGRTLADINTDSPEAGVSVISGAYFAAMGTPLVAGRTFSERDTVGAQPVLIINRAMARQSFAKTDPIGQKILCGFDDLSKKWATVVGVVGDERLGGPRENVMPEIYFSYLQHPNHDLNLLLKSRGNPVGYANQVRKLAASFDPEASLKLTTMESHLATSIATPRFSSILVSAFAALAALLAAIGIYAVVAYSVSQRTSEIGLRMALGADRRRMLLMVLKEAMQLCGAGVVAGVAGALLASHALKTQLFAVGSLDPVVYASVLVMLFAVTGVAALAPALRASRVEPLEALRQD